MTNALENLIDPSGFCADPDRIRRVAALFGLVSASSMRQIESGRALAAKLISENLTDAATFDAVQQITGASLFLFEEDARITGVLGFFPIRPIGVADIESGAFDARRIDLNIVSRPGERPAGIYAWGVAASSQRAGRAIIGGAAAIQEALFWAMPIYTRATTPDGERVLIGRLGFRRIDDLPDMVRRPPRLRALEGFDFGLAA